MQVSLINWSRAISQKTHYTRSSNAERIKVHTRLFFFTSLLPLQGVRRCISLIILLDIYYKAALATIGEVKGSRCARFYALYNRVNTDSHSSHPPD